MKRKIINLLHGKLQYRVIFFAVILLPPGNLILSYYNHYNETSMGFPLQVSAFQTIDSILPFPVVPLLSLFNIEIANWEAKFSDAIHKTKYKTQKHPLWLYDHRHR